MDFSYRNVSELSVSYFLCHSFSDRHAIKRESCVACGKCAEVCPTGALKLIGEDITPEEVVRRVVTGITLPERAESRSPEASLWRGRISVSLSQSSRKTRGCVTPLSGYSLRKPVGGISSEDRRARGKYDRISPVTLLPYHKTGLDKSALLDKSAQDEFEVPEKELMEKIGGWLIRVRIQGISELESRKWQYTDWRWFGLFCRGVMRRRVCLDFSLAVCHRQ